MTQLDIKGKSAEIESTIVFEKLFNEYISKKHRIIVLEGGTGSGKTVALAQLFAFILLRERGVDMTIARKTLPSLRATAMKDFFYQVEQIGFYNPVNHNKSELIYNYQGSQVDFIGVDEPQKVRSRRRKYLWLNEANEFSKESWMQLQMRTSDQIFLDYNPSDHYHWIYDELHTRDDCIVIPSTYRDNPFLPEAIVKEIESWREVDQDYWRVYGEGKRAITGNIIYNHWQLCDNIPEGADIVYGVDFGWNNPSAVARVGIKDNDLYWDEVVYEQFLTNQDLIAKIKEAGVERLIYPDPAEPARAKELNRAGFSTGKTDNSIRKGIDTIKSRRLFITKNSVNLLKEIKGYSWKTDSSGNTLDEPVKVRDHLLDAGRYASHSYLSKPTAGFEF